MVCRLPGRPLHQWHNVSGTLAQPEVAGPDMGFVLPPAFACKSTAVMGGWGRRLRGVPLWFLYHLVMMMAGKNILEWQSPLEGLLALSGSSLLQAPAAGLQSTANGPSDAYATPEENSR